MLLSICVDVLLFSSLHAYVFPCVEYFASCIALRCCVAEKRGGKEKARSFRQHRNHSHLIFNFNVFHLLVDLEFAAAHFYVCRTGGVVYLLSLYDKSCNHR